jgi:hypothetical protein
VADAPAEAALEDVPALVRARRLLLAKAGQARSFNLLRTALQSFLHETQGRRSALYLDLQDIKRLPYKRQRDGNPLTLAEMVAFCAALGPASGPAAMAMQLTGMGPGELYGAWERVDASSYHIHGTKRTSRDRRVPFIVELARPAATIHQLRRDVRAAAQRLGLDVVPYDFRRGYRMLMSGVIPPERMSAYMGHSHTLDDLYARPRADKFIAEDSEALRQKVSGELHGVIPPESPKLLTPGELECGGYVPDEQDARSRKVNTEGTLAEPSRDRDAQAPYADTSTVPYTVGRILPFE